MVEASIKHAQHIINHAARSVRSSIPAMPKRDEMSQELTDAEAAQQRGYFLPDEDERILTVFARYLSVRFSLLDSINSIQPLLKSLANPDNTNDEALQKELWKLRLQAFITGFAAATILMRAGTFMVNLADGKSVVSKKLDEAESRYGIQKKSFTLVYKNLSSSRRMWRYHEALMFFEAHSADIYELADDPIVKELISTLTNAQEFLEYRKRDYIKRKWSYKLHSFKRRHISGYRKVVFHLLKLSGSAVAEMKQPFIKPADTGKRVTPEVIAKIRPLLRAGDIFITRHDDAMSNLFLPGFWPHAALYIGTQEERDLLGVSLSPSDGRCLKCFDFLESKKDGVLFRSIEETLQVDAFMVLRPRLENPHMKDALMRAISHEGKLYDFMFDFSQSQRLACTALIYRGFHGVGPILFSLIQHAGRSCLSAEELIKQALTSNHFEKILDFGVEENDTRLFTDVNC